MSAELGGSSGERFAARKYEEPKEAKEVYIDWGLPLPETYGHDVLYGLVRDPYGILFYWELTGGRRIQVEEERGADFFHDGKWVLHVTNTDSGAEREWTVAYPLGNFYVDTAPHSNYVGRIGYRSASDDFVLFCETPPVHTPADGPSGDAASEFFSSDDLRRILGSGASYPTSIFHSSLLLQHRRAPEGGKK